MKDGLPDQPKCEEPEAGRLSSGCGAGSWFLPYWVIGKSWLKPYLVVPKPAKRGLKILVEDIMDAFYAAKLFTQDG